MSRRIVGIKALHPQAVHKAVRPRTADIAPDEPAGIHETGGEHRFARGCAGIVQHGEYEFSQRFALVGRKVEALQALQFIIGYIDRAPRFGDRDVRFLGRERNLPAAGGEISAARFGGRVRRGGAHGRNAGGAEKKRDQDKKRGRKA